MVPGAIHVVAAVIRDASGRVLLAQRTSGSHLEGLWEFPGGKREAGESPWQALVRELDEEIGIVASVGRPLIAVPFAYPGKRILLDVWHVDAYTGTPWSREGQALQWIDSAALDAIPMPAADRPVVAALRLPAEYLITPDLPAMPLSTMLAPIERALLGGIRLIQLRLPQWPRHQLLALAVEARALTRAHGAAVVVNTDVSLAKEADLDGVHLPARIAARFSDRPLPSGRWLGVSCHVADELAHAARIGADFATLSPVAVTASHPQTAPLGWNQFRELVAAAVMPVYALGGMRRSDAAMAREAGGQGVAAIGGLWPVRSGDS